MKEFEYEDLLDLEGFFEEDINYYLQEIQSRFNFQFPSDYIEFIMRYNGSEGEVGESGWLILFKASELLLFNESNKSLMLQVPEYFIFGKDAADTAYAFHKFNQTYHSFGFLSDFAVDEIQFCGNNIEEFLKYISTHS